MEERDGGRGWDRGGVRSEEDDDEGGDEEEDEQEEQEEEEEQDTRWLTPRRLQCGYVSDPDTLGDTRIYRTRTPRYTWVSLSG